MFFFPALLSVEMGKSIVRASDGDQALRSKAEAAPRAAPGSTGASVQPPYPGRFPPIVPAGVASGVADNGPAPQASLQARKPRAVPSGLSFGASDAPVAPVAPVTAPAQAPRQDAVADASPLRFRADAEQLARTRACHPQPVAALSATGPVSETYTIACLSGEPMVARCEADLCRELK